MKRVMIVVAIVAALFLCFSQVQVLAADINLAKKSTLGPSSSEVSSGWGLNPVICPSR